MLSALAAGKSKMAGVAIAGLLCVGGIAMAAPIGPTNIGFENGLLGWTATTNGSSYSEGDLRSAVYVLNGETFTVTPHGHNSVRQDTYTVNPAEGTKMVRLGHLFTQGGCTFDSGLDCVVPPDNRYFRAKITQDFKVDAANPVVNLRMNMFSWDSCSYDPTTFRIRLTNAAGALIDSATAHSPCGGRFYLATSGWVNVPPFDLTPYIGQDVHLQIAAGSTRDDIGGTWAYIDGLPGTGGPGGAGAGGGGGGAATPAPATAKAKKCKKKKSKKASASKKKCKKKK